MVGTEARMRPSSVIFVPSRGALGALRTSTRRPRTSPGRSRRSSMILMGSGTPDGREGRPSGPALTKDEVDEESERGADEHGEVDEAVGVAPLVVVPAHDLGLVALHG